MEPSNISNTCTENILQYAVITLHFVLFKGSPIRDPGSVEIYQCNNGASDELPHTDVSNCTIMDDQFKTLIEHGDW